MIHVFEITTSIIQPFQQHDIFEDAAGLLVCEELGIKARSVLASHEMLGSGWKLLPNAPGRSRFFRALSLSCFRKCSFQFKVFSWLMLFLTFCCLGTSAHAVVFLVTQIWWPRQGDEKQQFNGKQDTVSGGSKFQMLGMINLCLLPQTPALLRHPISIPRT